MTLLYGTAFTIMFTLLPKLGVVGSSPILNVEPVAALTLAWLVVVMSLGALTLLLYLIRRGAASNVASLFFLVPPSTALMAWPLFGEVLGPVEIGGVVVTESVYAIPGLGRLTVDAVLARDFPTIQGLILFFSCVYVLINLLVDLSYVFLDPRIRY